MIQSVTRRFSAGQSGKRLPKVLETNPLAVISALENAGDNEEIVYALSTLFINSGDPHLFAPYYCLSKDIKQAGSPEVVLRGSGIYTKFISAYIRISGQNYAHKVLLPLIKQIIDTNVQVEIQPEKMANPEDLENNARNLEKICDSFLQSITCSLSLLPTQISLICSETAALVAKKFQCDGTYAMISLFWLRFLGPILSMPESFGLLPECSQILRRKLILITKVVHGTLLNFYEEDKEEWMKAVGTYMTSNPQYQKSFVTHVNEIVESIKQKKTVLKCNSMLDKKASSKVINNCLISFVTLKKNEIIEYVNEVKANTTHKDVKLLNRCLKKEWKFATEEKDFDFIESIKDVSDLLDSNNLGPLKKSKSVDSDFFKNFQMTLESTLSYNDVVIRAADETGGKKLIHCKKEDISPDKFVGLIKGEFSKVKNVEYYIDGNYCVLDKLSFQDFEGSAVVHNNTAYYRIRLWRKDQSTLLKYAKSI